MVLGIAARQSGRRLRMPEPKWVWHNSWHVALTSASGEEDRFVRQARRVSDYLIASGSPLAGELETALRSFDDTGGDNESRAALQAAASHIYPLIEKRTLAAVLNGSFKPGATEKEGRKVGLFSPINVVAAIGLVLIAASLHWTYWSTRAEAVIASLDSVLETQRNLNIEDIVHTRDLCQYQDAQLDDQDVYRFVVATRDMSYYDTIWVSARDEAQYLKVGFWPLQQQFRDVGGAIADLFTRKESSDGEDDFGPQILGGGIRASVSADEGANGSEDKIADIRALGSENICDRFLGSDQEKPRTLETQYDWYRASFADMAKTIPLSSGVELFRGTGIASIEVLKKELAESQVVVHRWLLPTLHGALGAVIFCLVRAIREPFLLPLGHRDVMLRIFFGAFVGYLISALFIPSGILGTSASGAAPITSLAAFIFGYSIDSFIALLNRMNSYISQLPDQNKAKPG